MADATDEDILGSLFGGEKKKTPVEPTVKLGEYEKKHDFETNINETKVLGPEYVGYKGETFGDDVPLGRAHDIPNIEYAGGSNYDNADYISKAAKHLDRAVADVTKGTARTAKDVWGGAIDSADEIRRKVTPSGRETMESIDQAYNELKREDFKYDKPPTMQMENGVFVGTEPNERYNILTHKHGEQIRSDIAKKERDAAIKKTLESGKILAQATLVSGGAFAKSVHADQSKKFGAQWTKSFGTEDARMKMRFAPLDTDTPDEINEKKRMYKSYKDAKDQQEMEKSLNKRSMADTLTARGLLNMVGESKLAMDAASMGGAPQGKIVWETYPGGYVTEDILDKENNVIGKKYVRDKDGNLKPTHFVKYAKYEQPMITIPIKTKEGWQMSQPVPADAANLRLAIDRRRSMQSETEKKEADTGYKLAQTSDQRSLIAARERNANLVEARVQAARTGRVKFGSTNFGREPIYMRTDEMGSTREKYTLGGGGGVLAPTVLQGLARNRQGMSRMAARALAGNAAPMAINPLMRVGLPDVVGNRMQMDPRYVTGPQVPAGVLRLSLNQGGGSGVRLLSPFKKKKRQDEYG